MCHQLVSSGIPAESLDLRSTLFLTMRNDALWGCQTLLCNWVTIKIVLGYIMKYGMECVRIKMELELQARRCRTSQCWASVQCRGSARMRDWWDFQLF